MSFTKPEQKKTKNLKKRCYRCASTEGVKTFGNNDWCPKCRRELEGQRNDGTLLVETSDEEREKKYPTQAGRIPFQSTIDFDKVVPKLCQPYSREER